MKSTTHQLKIHNNFPKEFFNQDSRVKNPIKPIKLDQNTVNQINVQQSQVTPTFQEKGSTKFIIPKLDLIKICNNQDFKKTFSKIKKIKTGTQSTMKPNELLLGDNSVGQQIYPKDVFSAPCMSTRFGISPQSGMNLYQKIKMQQLNGNMKRLYPKQLPPLKPVQHKIVKNSKSQQILQRRLSDPASFQDEKDTFNYTFSSKEQLIQTKHQNLLPKQKKAKSALRLRIPSHDKELDSIIYVDNNNRNSRLQL